MTKPTASCIHIGFQKSLDKSRWLRLDRYQKKKKDKKMDTIVMRYVTVALVKAMELKYPCKGPQYGKAALWSLVLLAIRYRGPIGRTILGILIALVAGPGNRG